MNQAYNQNFVPAWNSIYQNLVNKISKSLISSNVYQSPFSAMLQDLEVGRYVEDIHINPGQALVFETVPNSDVFNDYFDDIATAIYEVDVDLTYPSTYVEYVVRESSTMLENANSLITALTANIRTTLEIHRNNLVKQMLYNAYQYGMLDSIVISDPLLNQRTSGQFAVALNVTIDDFITEVTTRNVIYNNQVGITENQKRKTIGKEIPYIIVFNEYIRDVEFVNAVNLGLIERWRGGNQNQDWQTRLIKLNKADFPNSIPPIPRSQVTGQNVPAYNVNFFEMPVAADGTPLFSGEPTGGDTILAFVLEPEALKLFTQLSIVTNYMNPATLKVTNREIYRGIMQLGAFNKIRVITCNKGEEVTPTMLAQQTLGMLISGDDTTEASAEEVKKLKK